MAYETGTASDLVDLIDKLRIFANAQGWTINEYNAPGDGSSELFISKTGVGYFVFQHPTVGQSGQSLFMYGATGYNAGAAYNAQPGTTGDSIETNAIVGPFPEYHFFGDPDGNYLHCVVAVGTNDYRHFGVGIGTKYGVFTGGEYVYGLWWDESFNDIDREDGHGHAWPLDHRTYRENRASKFRADIDAHTDYWFTFSYNEPSASRARSFSLRETNIEGDHRRHAWNRSPNVFNQLAVLWQPFLMAFRGDGTYSILGHVEDLAYMNMENYLPAEEFAIGADTWKVFPVTSKKNENDETRESGDFGLAYRKVT